MSTSKGILDTSIDYLKGVGPIKADMLKKELKIFTYQDLLQSYPFRHVDKTKFHKIREVNSNLDYVQMKGIINNVKILGDKYKRRLVAQLKDETGIIQLVWFKGINWLQKILVPGKEYVVYGKVNAFKGRLSIPHPEVESIQEAAAVQKYLAPVYHSTEKLNSKGLDAKGRRNIMKGLFQLLKEEDIPEILPEYLLNKVKLISRYRAFLQVHFPRNQSDLDEAINRLKFDEIFFLQLRLLQIKSERQVSFKGHDFKTIGPLFNKFYSEKLPFELTNAQKKVLKEIRADLGSGAQMNRLLQGDVGSGKTMVAIMSILIALDNNYQTCLLAPTEILAQQHFIAFNEYLSGLDINISFLSGSVKGKKRAALLENLKEGEINILIGTHAILEDPVVFKNLGLAITDEQHRFGVAQRAKLWHKSKPKPPHILVMTATPIPRTLAMTTYGDLDVSVIDELPPGRKLVETMHKTESNRLWIQGLMKRTIAVGQQIYIVYPLIEESAKLDLNNLMQGYETLLRDFGPPEYQISIVHGKMKPKDKEFEMQRFIKKETQIMIATTVIEVGVNVPNASLMIIENTERFGLSQLHQLRGRVGRGAEKSYCVLMTGEKVTQIGMQRIQTMCKTNDGFQIAEADLQIRGPGNLDNTQQSGFNLFKISDIAKDQELIKMCRNIAQRIIDHDPLIEHEQNKILKVHLKENFQLIEGWSNIS